MFITLTTDMGLKDYYVATLKGAIYSELPDAKIIDISHNIPPFDITHAAFVIKNSFKHFPKNTIHVIGIDAEPSDLTRHIIVETQDQYFIGADNGIFSLIFDKQPDGVWEINLKTDGDEYSFPTKNIFIKAACHLARGGLPAVIGKPLDKIKSKQLFRPIIENDGIKGMVSYIDEYGNIITNISKQLFKEIGKNRAFNINLTRSGYSIQKIHNRYGEVPEGERIALFGSSGFLEISINKGVQGSGGGASQLFGIGLNDTITIDFKD
ncbi:MAG: SAM-dependent chlorinase/fluorinase [Flavobacteriales bacterium]|nr:SAM-dependent chlorinase/fluorinase [Flavobacteriales bacterium]